MPRAIASASNAPAVASTSAAVPAVPILAEEIQSDSGSDYDSDHRGQDITVPRKNDAVLAKYPGDSRWYPARMLVSEVVVSGGVGKPLAHLCFAGLQSDAKSHQVPQQPAKKCTTIRCSGLWRSKVPIGALGTTSDGRTGRIKRHQTTKIMYN
jgi:hypothetical protein